MPKSQAPASESAGPSRRTFLTSTAVAAVAVAGGVPLLSACSSDTAGGGGTTTGSAAKKILPAYVERTVVAPDIPSTNGSAAGFTKAISSADLVTSVEKKLGTGANLQIMSPFWGTPPKNNNAYYVAMNKAIGVNLSWQNQDGNYYDQKLGAVLASSNIPDMVVVPGWNLTGKIPSAVVAKFADLGPYLSGDKVKDYPNLAAIPTDAWQRSIFGGKLRGLPMPGSSVPNITPFYRKDVFDKKGWQLPTSADEFLALAKEITSAKNKVWACDDMLWTAWNSFGVFPNGDRPLWWGMVDGKLVNRVEQPEYLEALEWVGKLYAAGVVHPDAKAEQGNAGDRFTAGQVMMYNDDESSWYGIKAQQAAQNPGLTIWGMDIFGHAGGKPQLWANNPANIWSFVNKNASEETIKNALAIANFTASPYGTKEWMLTQYGVEGTDYTVKNGLPVKTATGNTEVVGSYTYVASPAPFVAHPDYPDITKAMVDWQQRMGALTKKTPFFGLNVTEPSQYQNLADNFEDLEKDIVRGRKKISDMQQAVSEWKRNGGDKLRDWYKKLLDENGSAS